MYATRFLLTLVVATSFLDVILCSRLHTTVNISASNVNSTCAPWHYVDPSTRKCNCPMTTMIKTSVLMKVYIPYREFGTVQRTQKVRDYS